MAKFYGKIGFDVGAVEVKPGVWEEQPQERSYYGDVLRSARQLENGVSINDDVNVRNRISIVADAYANEHINAMRYVEWMGSRWKITEIEVERPRLILTVGGLYNGTTD